MDTDRQVTLTLLNMPIETRERSLTLRELRQRQTAVVQALLLLPPVAHDN